MVGAIVTSVKRTDPVAMEDITVYLAADFLRERGKGWRHRDSAIKTVGSCLAYVYLICVLIPSIGDVTLERTE